MNSTVIPTDEQRLTALYWETRLRHLHEDSGAPGDMLAAMRRSYVRDAAAYAIGAVVDEFIQNPHPAQNTGYLLPPLFTENLGDDQAHRPYIERLGHDPRGVDDTVFGAELVYCASHRDVHSTGWCTANIGQKVPLAATLGASADLHRAQDEARALGFSIFEDTSDYWDWL